MGKNTFTITFEDGTTASQSIFISDPEIIKGWWSSDKDGKNILKESQLEETVFFHVETKGIASGQELELKLFDYDNYVIAMLNNIAINDDDKFPDEEIIKKAKLRTVDGKRLATIELLLDKKWESVVKDDADMFINLDKKIELYWQVKYGTKLNEKLNSVLKVGFSDKTLYFKSPVDGHNLPELISYDGSPLLFMKLGSDMLKGEAKNKIGKALGKSIDKAVHHIALAKMEKGSLGATNGKIYTRNSQIFTKDIYTNDGKFLKGVKQGNNIGFIQDGKSVTTKGLSQYDYFTQKGKRVRLLGFLKSAGHLFDFGTLLNSAKDGFDTSKPLSIPLGPLSPLNDLAGVLVQQYADDLDQSIEIVIQELLAEAKAEGLSAVQRFVYNHSNNKKNKYELMAISTETASKLLQGEFKTFEELKKHADANRSRSINIEMLYRTVFNKNREEDIYIVETIFINE